MHLAEILLAGLLIVVFIVSLLANLLVLICFLYSAEIRKQVSGIFLVNLSLCNLLLTILNMPSTFLAILNHHQPFGDCICKALGFLETFLTSNTMLSMAALSIDKWIAVVFPLSYTSKMRYKDAVIMMGYTWLHSLTFPLVSLFLSWLDYSSMYASCTLHIQDAPETRRFMAFTIVFHAASFMLSLVILCFTYLKVLKVARFHCRRIDIITMQTLVLLVDIHPSVKQRCLSEQKRRRQRATKKISIFIGSFVVCFAPYVITSIMFFTPLWNSLPEDVVMAKSIEEFKRGLDAFLKRYDIAGYRHSVTSMVVDPGRGVRLIELLPYVRINNYWGIASKCLAYSKAAADPFVYSLLRQQYKKVLLNIVNRILKRELYPSSGYNSSLDTENEYCLHRAS